MPATQSARIKPTHKSIKAYYAALEAFSDQNVDHEMAVRSAFQTLIAECGRAGGVKWTLIPEQSATVTVDGKSGGGSTRWHVPR